MTAGPETHPSDATDPSGPTGSARRLGTRETADLARQVLFPSAPKPYAVMGAPLPLRCRQGDRTDFHRPVPPG